MQPQPLNGLLWEDWLWENIKEKIMYKLEKPYTEKEKMDFIFKYNQDCLNEGYNCKIEETENALFALEENEILQDGKIIINPDYEAKILTQAKENKIIENDNLRDEALNKGVVYNNILFDSDTDQKVNLLATVSSISDTDTITWFGMNNDSLICTKQDLINIGGLITQLHSFCWTKNAEIKEQIKQAKTIEEVENIEIDYRGVN